MCIGTDESSDCEIEMIIQFVSQCSISTRYPPAVHLFSDWAILLDIKSVCLIRCNFNCTDKMYCKRGDKYYCTHRTDGVIAGVAKELEGTWIVEDTKSIWKSVVKELKGKWIVEDTKSMKVFEVLVGIDGKLYWRTTIFGWLGDLLYWVYKIRMYLNEFYGIFCQFCGHNGPDWIYLTDSFKNILPRYL